MRVWLIHDKRVFRFAYRIPTLLIECMKHRLIIASTLLLLAFHFPLLAQPYRSLPLNGARWKINYTHKNFPLDLGSFFMTSMGDTVIGGLQATRVVTGQAAACSGQAFAFHVRSRHFFHQDSLGRVYELWPNGQMVKRYDLSLQVGDTLQTTDFSSSPITYTVDSIGILQFSDNIPRKALYVTAQTMNGTGFFSPVVWVEGIGDIYNGPVPVPGIESWNEAACYSEDERLLVTNPYIGPGCMPNCNLLVGMPTPSALTLTISPNPARDHVRITQVQASALHARLLALDGRVAGTWDLDGADAHTLELPQVVPGLYLLEVRDETGRMVTRRVRLE